MLAGWDRLVCGALALGVPAVGIRAQILSDSGGFDCAWLLEEAFTSVCDFFAFAVLLARFGPYGSLLAKIAQSDAIVRKSGGGFVAPRFRSTSPPLSTIASHSRSRPSHQMSLMQAIRRKQPGLAQSPGDLPRSERAPSRPSCHRATISPSCKTKSTVIHINDFYPWASWWPNIKYST